MLKCTLRGGGGTRGHRVKCRASCDRNAVANHSEISATISILRAGEARPVRRERSVHTHVLRSGALAHERALLSMSHAAICVTLLG